MMNRRCNCSDYYSAQEFYFHGELFNSAERLCDYTNGEDEDCFSDVFSDIATAQECKKCHAPCRYVSYQTAASSSYWPSPAYLVSTLMSSIGGATALYLGIYGITIFEIFSFLFVTATAPRKKSKAEEIAEIWHEFAARTSLGGIAQIENSTSNPVRIVWLGIFGALVGFTMWNTFAVAHDYFTFPVTTVVAVTSAGKLVFPTVTLCNRNPVECSKLAVLYVQDRDDGIVKNLLNYSGCLATVTKAPLIYRTKHSINSFTQCKSFIRKAMFPEFELDDYDPNSKASFKSLEVDLADKFYSELAVIYKDSSKRKLIPTISQGFKSFVMNCKQKDSDFTTSFIPLYGLCYVYHHRNLMSSENAAVQAWVHKWNNTLSAGNWSISNNSEPSVAEECQKSWSKIYEYGTNETISDPAGDQWHIDHTKHLINSFTQCKSFIRKAMFPEFELDDYDPNSSASFKSQEVDLADKFYSELAVLYKDSSKRKLIPTISQGFKSFVVNCKQKDRSCRNESDFTTSFIPLYGLCYVYHHRNVGLDPGNVSMEYTTQSGTYAGLTLEIRFGNEEYCPSLVGSGTGARVGITHPGVLPKPIEEGHFVSPNRETKFALRVSNVRRLKAPYRSKCWESWERTPLVPLIPKSATSSEFDEGKIYSQTDCQNLCFNLLLLRQCNCSDYYSVQMFRFRGNLTNASERQDKACFQNVLRNRDKYDHVGCNCNLPCNSPEFMVMKFYYQLSTIMAELGGAAGIYLGVCGITVFEVVCFLWLTSGINARSLKEDFLRVSGRFTVRCSYRHKRHRHDNHQDYYHPDVSYGRCSVQDGRLHCTETCDADAVRAAEFDGRIVLTGQVLDFGCLDFFGIKKVELLGPTRCEGNFRASLVDPVDFCIGQGGTTELPSSSLLPSTVELTKSSVTVTLEASTSRVMTATSVPDLGATTSIPDAVSASSTVVNVLTTGPTTETTTHTTPAPVKPSIIVSVLKNLPETKIVSGDRANITVAVVEGKAVLGAEFATELFSNLAVGLISGLSLTVFGLAAGWIAWCLRKKFSSDSSSCADKIRFKADAPSSRPQCEHFFLPDTLSIGGPVLLAGLLVLPTSRGSPNPWPTVIST
ncbi:unnamed protein product [Notodromas monacha]|uniref:Uncharacterized protein n=1 Tax=Notodromas monacha TaxID=399045 RepID=A0A7R9GFS4_9CRUS|nr:unnamed protein product [Notodromas monacha]CAG0919462.1 unnamed protein product [Notodromas monacha]